MIFAPLFILAIIGLAILLKPWPLYRRSSEQNPDNDYTPDRNIALSFVIWVERQALMHGLSVRGVARPVPVECPKCKKSSNYFVYPDELCERCWTAKLKKTTMPVKSNRT